MSKLGNTLRSRLVIYLLVLPLLVSAAAEEENDFSCSVPVNSATALKTDLEISDDFGELWRYLEQAPEMSIELDQQSILEEEYRSMFTLEHRSTAKRAESMYMPSSTRSNKETQLLFSPDPASLERSIRKEARSSSIDNTTYSLIDFCQPPSNQTLVPSTNSLSPLSTEDTHLPSTDIFHPTSIETHTATSIDTAHQISTDTPKEESVDSSQGEWENDYYIPTMATHTMHREEYDEDYEEERAVEQRVTLDEEDRLLHHSSWKKKSPSIDRYGSTSIETQPHQPNHLRASTDDAYFPSIDTNVDATRDRDYSIGSFADNHCHESYAVETAYRDQGDDELNEGFTYEELLNMQRRDETYQNRAATAWERTNGCARAIDGRTLHVSREDIADILQTADGADNLFIHQRNIPEHQQKESYDTTSSIDKRRFYWEEKDEYGIYRDDQGYARDLDGHTIRVHNRDLEQASRDELSYICLPEHASSFTQTKLVPKIYTKDEINEMFYGVCGEHEKNKEAFQMKLDGVYYPLNDSIS
ncbi:hypothetical protein F2Q68_00034857 [Brassica cretica]|uniref:Ig-like domain-containing protein n=1 Tax=Brassica cretica TaxID=69181 RepID=A0A8S9H0T2_BRACR|nr:hypothetical protein F2Q68_00034857 [Brassica cretica]